MSRKRLIRYGLLLVIAAIAMFVRAQHITTPSASLPTTSQLVPAGQMRVVKVDDGDTVVLSDGSRALTIRLIGIDTPEVVDPRKPVQCFGKEASENTKHILPAGTLVKLEKDPSQGEHDKYGRTLGYIILLDGTNLNQKIIADGFAHEYTYQNNPYKYQAEFKAAEQDARANNRGLWSLSTCNGDTTKPAS